MWFEFTRKLRLKEYFGSCEDTTIEDEQISEDQDSKYQTKGNSTFILPAGRDTVLDFYIKAITHEIFTSKRKWNIKSDLSQEEQVALKSLSQDDNIVIKKSDKGSKIAIMNREDYIAEAQRQLNNSTYYEVLSENPHEQFRKDIEYVVKTIDCQEIDVKNLYKRFLFNFIFKYF